MKDKKESFALSTQDVLAMRKIAGELGVLSVATLFSLVARHTKENINKPDNFGLREKIRRNCVSNESVDMYGIEISPETKSDLLVVAEIFHLENVNTIISACLAFTLATLETKKGVPNAPHATGNGLAVLKELESAHFILS